jgi:Putative stress-induced transcription regulator
MRQRRSIPDSDWRDGFLFVGNHLALDFLNTRPVQDGEPRELLSDFEALLRWFQAAGLLSSHEMARLQRQSGESAAAIN